MNSFRRSICLNFPHSKGFVKWGGRLPGNRSMTAGGAQSIGLSGGVVAGLASRAMLCAPPSLTGYAAGFQTSLISLPGGKGASNPKGCICWLRAPAQSLAIFTLSVGALREP